MKWHRPNCCFVPPVPTNSIATGGGLSSPLYSDDGRLLCCDALAENLPWSIVENPFPSALVDGETLSPITNNYFDGALAWEGDSWVLHYSIAHRAWILRLGTLGSVPVASQDWASGAWKGDAWYQGALSYKLGTYSFAPAGTLLDDSSAESKTVALVLPRWEWTADGYSSAPIGKYAGKDGAAGVKYVGSAAYVEAGSSNVWFRRGQGNAARLKRENGTEETSARLVYAGIGYGWGLSRGDVLYFSATLPAGESGGSFSPYRWDEDRKRYVADADTDALELTYKGRTMGREAVGGFFTEPMLWR